MLGFDLVKHLPWQEKAMKKTTKNVLMLCLGSVTENQCSKIFAFKWGKNLNTNMTSTEKGAFLHAFQDSWMYILFIQASILKCLPLSVDTGLFPAAT